MYNRIRIVPMVGLTVEFRLLFPIAQIEGQTAQTQTKRLTNEKTRRSTPPHPLSSALLGAIHLCVFDPRCWELPARSDPYHTCNLALVSERLR